MERGKNRAILGETQNDATRRKLKKRDKERKKRERERERARKRVQNNRIKQTAR